MSFEDLISKTTNVATMVEAGSTTKKSYNDERIWKPSVDKAGNGYAVIRFLPALEGQDLPWVRYWDHGFKGATGKWYFEKSLTSIGQADPLGELNQKLWNSGSEADKETARKQKRRLHYVSNILVVSDPANPENEGKVFMYTYGKKIFDKIMDMMQPKFPGETPLDPFHFMQGADFRVKIANVAGFRNYDKSDFAPAGPCLGGDIERLKAVYNQMHDISEFTDPKNYKSYEELKAKLNDVLGVQEPQTTQQQISLDETAAPKPTAVAPAPMESAPVVASPESYSAPSAEPQEEDTMSYFASLAQGD